MWPFSRLLRGRAKRDLDGRAKRDLDGRAKREAEPAASPGQEEASGDEALSWDPDAAVALPIDGALDLHHFHPRDLRTLVPEYLRECRAKGILEVRVIHGKGKGNLRRSVHALLERDASVRGYRLCPPERGGWGATLVDLWPGSGDATED